MKLNTVQEGVLMIVIGIWFLTRAYSGYMVTNGEVVLATIYFIFAARYSYRVVVRGERWGDG